MRAKRTTDAKTLSEADLRVIARWVAACAARALPLFEARAPSDTRPRDALDVIQRALGRATPALRAIVRRFPRRRAGRGRLEQLFARLDTGLR